MDMELGPDYTLEKELEDLTTEGNRVTTKDLAAIHSKLDEILGFQKQLLPFLPLLQRVSEFVDNPATKFRDFTRMRKGVRRDGQN